jgi:trehalose/maltose hydrolase-like predicted phosphorylase
MTRTIGFKLSAALICAWICAGGCTPEKATVPTKAADPWVLSSQGSKVEDPALLWNGLLGFRLGPDGSGHGLPFFAIDEYDTAGEEKLRALPNPLDIRFTADGKPLVLDPKRPFHHELDMRTGELRTHWISTSRVTVDVLTVLHPEKRQIGQQWNFASDHATTIKMVPANFSRLPIDVNQSPGELHLAPDSPDTLSRVISLGRSSNWINMQSARGIAVRMREGWNQPAKAPDFSDLQTDSEAVWSRRWRTDIQIEGPPEDQQAIRSFMFYLWGSIHPDGGMSVSPMGLSSTNYNGHVFWDADMWVAPALSFFNPEGAKAIAEYRISRISRAEENARQWIAAGRPTGVPNHPVESKSGAGTAGLKFPWESSVSGRETVPGPSKFEDHISGSVAWSIARAHALGLVPNSDSLLSGVAKFYDARSSRGSDGLRHIEGTMSPDENHVGDDDLYTNLLAMWATGGGAWPNRQTYFLPKDEQSYLTYSGDTLRGYKQAAAILAIYPLQYPPAEGQAKVMMERFSGKVTKNGPAMSDSIDAVIWARLGEKSRAYKAWRESWQPFTKSPLMLFSEKRSSPKTYFTTGAAGSLNSVVYGFLGFRLDSEQESGAAWSKHLNGDYWLSIKPNLPPAWKSVKFKNFQLLGKSYTLTATPDSTKVTQGE